MCVLLGLPLLHLCLSLYKASGLDIQKCALMTNSTQFPETPALIMSQVVPTISVHHSVNVSTLSFGGPLNSVCTTADKVKSRLKVPQCFCNFLSHQEYEQKRPLDLGILLYLRLLLSLTCVPSVHNHCRCFCWSHSLAVAVFG